MASVGVETARGYQTHFPTPIQGAESIAAPPGGMGTPNGSPLPQPSLTTPPNLSTPPNLTTPPNLSTPPNLGSASPGMLPGAPGGMAGPVPGYGGTAQSPPPNWDPYSPPGSATTTPLLPQDYYPTMPALPALPASVGRLQRLIDEIRLDYHYLAPRGSKPFGTNDLELNTTLAFPLFYNQETPLYVTPGFAFHWWQGPTGGGLLPTEFLGQLPPRVYDAYLGAAWNPRITQQVGGELAFRVGVYSDFDKVSAQSLRYTGHGLLTLALSPAVKIKGGIVYYDRVRIKMLPAAGVVWTPNADTVFDIFFPAPKISRRLANYGNTEWWLYGRGEYGGGSWTVKPSDYALEQMDYNDLRAALGLEFNRMDRIRGLVEIGTAFDRELLVRNTGEKFSPSATIFLRAGLVR